MDKSSYKSIVSDGKKPYVIDQEFRELKAGEVLVKVEATTINSVDRLVAMGLYEAPEFRDNPEYGVGYEGSGIVEEGFGEDEKKLVGSVVAFFQDPSLPGYQGAWRQYIYLNARDVIPFPPGTDVQSVCSVTNPITVFPMMEQVRDGKHKAVILGAACSAIGKMIIRKCRQLKIPTISIIRKSHQRVTLEEIGAENILDSTSKTFVEDLKEIATDLEATIFFDPVGGDLSMKVLEAMPPLSTISFMDNMSKKKVVIDPLQIIFAQKTITSVNLSEWMKVQSQERIGEVIGEIAGDLAQGGEVYGTDIYTSYSIFELKDALKSSYTTASRGKTIFKPNSL